MAWMMELASLIFLTDVFQKCSYQCNYYLFIYFCLSVCCKMFFSILLNKRSEEKIKARHSFVLCNLSFVSFQVCVSCCHYFFINVSIVTLGK